MGLKSDAFHFFEARNDTFLIKSPPPQIPPFEKKLHFDLLGHQVDPLSFLFSPKFWGWGTNLSSNGPQKLRISLFWSAERHLFDEKAPQKPPFWNFFAFWPIGSSSRHSQLYFEPKILGVGPKLSPLRDLRMTGVTFSKRKMTLFWWKRLSKCPPFEKFGFEFFLNQL